MTAAQAAASAPGPAPAQTVALLGCGAMGRRMGLRLLAAGHRLRVYNRSAAAAEPLLAAGASGCVSPAQAAEGADAVLSMVTDDAASERMWWAADGALAGANVGANVGAVAGTPATAGPAAVRRTPLVLECSTLSLGAAASWHARATRAGALALAAPVLGSLPQAEAGQLVVLAGGSAPALERAEPLLALLSSRVVAAGCAQQAMLLKLMVNSLLATQVAWLGEWWRTLGAAGLDPAHSWPQLAELPVVSPALRAQAALVLAERHAPQFPVALVAKDLRYALQALQALHSPQATPCSGVTEAVAERFAALARQGAAALNISAAAAGGC